ncbi:hypothetical protein T459_09248 [Capsicum annuum]|uniref:Uncharacterized protein n=1 Tax=Capsicum annuum TaxID=4072 RepID=A0A2G2ZYT9_CAPAN|nr:hypothetical protein T459_09248 [Capsicum annuum]
MCKHISDAMLTHMQHISRGCDSLRQKAYCFVLLGDVYTYFDNLRIQVSSVVLCEDIVNLLDFIKRLKNEEDQIVIDMDQIEKLKLELTFLSACLQLCYYILDGSNAEMSCILYEVHDLVKSFFHQSGDDMLVKLKDHVVPHLLENI